MERRDRLHKDIFITVSGAAWLIPENGDFLKEVSVFSQREHLKRRDYGRTGSADQQISE